MLLGHRFRHRIVRYHLHFFTLPYGVDSSVGSPLHMISTRAKYGDGRS